MQLDLRRPNGKFVRLYRYMADQFGAPVIDTNHDPAQASLDRIVKLARRANQTINGTQRSRPYPVAGASQRVRPSCISKGGEVAET